MAKKIYLAILISLSIGSITLATFVAQRAARKAKTPVRGAQVRRKARPAAAKPGPARPPDPNRAPQNLVDDALYSNEEFFGSQASVARPYSLAFERVSALLGKYPKDARLHLYASRLGERLGQFDKAAAEINEYADLRGRSPDALRRLADFYHHRARFADEVRTLQELAKAQTVATRTPIYKRAAELVRTRSLKEFAPADFFAELVAADPSNIQPVTDYVEELRLSKRNKEALAALASYQPRFPSELHYFLKARAHILETTGDRRGAEEVYASTFDPNWPRAIAGDYYELLRRFGRYRIVRRGLQERVRAGATDLDTVGRLFSVFSYEGSYEQAAKLLRDLEDRRAGKKAQASTQPQSSQPPAVATASWSARELETVAELFTSIGHYDQASRYLYTFYLVGGLQAGSGSREEALYRLFKVMLDAAGNPTRVAGGDLSFYRDVAEVDQHPGFLNGVLSLVLSGVSPSQEFANQETAAAGYFNRAFAYRIFTSFKQEYAESKHLPEMYLGIVNVFAALSEHKLAIEAGREFQKLYPDSPSYSEVSLRVADSHVALKDRANERAVLSDLLDRLARNQPKGLPLVAVAPKHWSYGITPGFENLIDKIRYKIEAYSDTYDPTEDKAAAEESEDNEVDSEVTDVRRPAESEARRGPTYSGVLERYVSSLAAEEKKTETVAFFWGEIKKHPKEEGLYERFLRWLGQAQLINEQLKAYDSAIKQFDSNTWYHRLGRWYVRQKRGKELTAYSKQLIGLFDEDEITEYLLRFAGYGATAGGDALNWDERLAFDLYSVAHTRFSRNLFFVRGMLTYLEKNDRARWEKLSNEYYFADRSIREPYLAWLSKQGKLREAYAQAKARRADGATGRVGAPSPSAYSVFAADASLWLSHHDEALDAYRQLVAFYPGEPQYADRLADLTRSFGQQSDKLYEESARVFAQMADIYPSDHTYRIKAGEVYAQLGDFKRAAEQWDKLIQIEPGERNTYLEVATVFWDYYQFDQALRVFKELRNVTGDQTIYAYRMGAVYEGKGDLDSAIAEYVNVLSEPGEGRDTVSKRLTQLSKRAGVAEKIAAAYERARVANPADWQLIIGYAGYQAERDHQADALAMLRTEVARSNDVAFLESVRDLFRAILRQEDEQQAIARLMTIARDEREAMMYRLQLASFLERHGQVDGAIALIDKLVGDYPTNVGVVEESAKFYWRAGLLDRSLDLYKRTLARSLGTNRRSFALLLARRQIEANKLADAEATLRAFYNENHLDTEVFGELARTLGAEKKLNELATLYQEAFQEAREAGLGGDETKSRVAALRDGMIRTLDSLGKYQDAVDQHIEIINSFPEDADRLAAAIEYAEQHNLIERLVGYYEKLSRESNKNYRWQVVLGRIYERRGNLAGAADQYRIAVLNEPQRSDLRFTLASVLARQRRYDEAIATLREGWTLAGRDPEWLIEVARIQVQQGQRDEAVKTIRQALAAKKNSSIEAQVNIAGHLASWGLNSEAVRVYEQVLADLPKKLEDDNYFPSPIAGYVKALMRSEPVASVYQKVERLRAQASAIAENSQSYKARYMVEAIDGAMRSDFGKGVIDYATTDESAALASALQASTAKLTLYSDAQALKRYLGIARGAGLVDLEEQLQIRLKDSAFEARPKNAPTVTPQDSAYYDELRALVGFYERHGSYGRAAELLASEFRRDPYKNRFDYQNQIATQYRLTGDQNREIEWLRAAYAAASGALTTNYTDWVDRYLTLLHSTGQRGELQRLASTYNAYQLQLINFLVEKNEKLLALDAIDNAKQSQAWVRQRSGELGLFLKDTSPENEPFFQEALDIKPIGQMLGRRIEGGRALVGSDWFVGSRNYGYWLGMVGREIDSRRFIVGEIEGHPSSERAHLELAAYYLDKKNTSRASDHVALASELAPGDTDVAVIRGTVLLASRDRNGALDAWGAIMSGRVKIADAESYLKVMADNGFLIEALPRLETFLVSFVSRALRDKQASDRIEAIKPLVREIASRAGNDPKTQSEAGTFFHNTINSIPGDLVIGRMLIEEELLPESALASIYRTMHQRISDIAAGVLGTPAYEDGYYSGSEYIYPARELASWRKRLVDYLIRGRLFDEARLLVATIKREQADQKIGLESHEEEDGSAYDDRYDWLPLSSALIELRGGRDVTKAIAELRRYCGIEKTEGERQRAEGTEDGTVSHERCSRAHALLLAEGREREADSLLYEAYGKTVRSRYSDDASLVGLAEIEARRGRGEEASRLLKLLVQRSTDNTRALLLAAETAGRTGRYSDAIDFREQIARANPDDAVNRLELARAVAAAGRTSDAVDQIVALIAERGTPNTVRAQAAEVLGEMVRADRSLASRAASPLDRQGRSDAAAALARAAISEATGNREEARAMLAGVAAGPLAAVAQMKLGLLALAAGRDAEAVTSFERAMYLDADGSITNSIAFRAPGPRTQLIILYGKRGRDLAAIRLAEAEPEGPQSLISSAVRRALSSGVASADSRSTVSFEPSLEVARSRSAGLKTIAELNVSAAASVQGEMLASLVESAARLGQYDRAMAIERLRAAETSKPDEKTAIEKRLAEIAAAEKARQARLASLTRIDRSNATESIYAARVLGN